MYAKHSLQFMPQGAISSVAGVAAFMGSFRFAAKFLFQCRHALEQLGQMLDGNHLALGLLVRLRGRAEPFLAVGNVVHHAGLRGDNNLIADLQMAADADLPGQHDVFAKLRAARDADLPDNDAVLADLDVVRDLNEVINLRALADDRRAERAAVHRDVRADPSVLVANS